jgi:flagellar basal-body rod modification protein FlgD
MTTAASAMPATVVALPTGTQLPNSANGLSSTGQALNENDFLQLLTAQLENQDPLDPTTADEFASELAEFSTATGVQNLETTSSGQQAAALVGQNVAVNGNSLILGNGGATGALNLSTSASNVAVTIRNSAGNTLASLNLGALPAGTQTFSWSGASSNGATVAPGTYNFSVTAVGTNGAAVAATPYAVAPVTSVTLGGNSGPMLDLGGGVAPVPLSSVQQVF